MKRSEEAALKAYPIHPYTIGPKEGAHGEILNFYEWLDDFRISIQSFSSGTGFIKGYEQAEKETLDYACYKLELRLPEYLNYNGVQVERAEFIKDFRKVMEEE